MSCRRDPGDRLKPATVAVGDVGGSRGHAL
jgi:hypothetical protein